MCVCFVCGVFFILCDELCMFVCCVCMLIV